MGVGSGLASLDDLLDLFAMWHSCWLVLEIDSSLLMGGSTSIQQRHWVVVDPETLPLIRLPGSSTGLTSAQFRAKREAAARGSVQGATDAYGGMAALNSERARQQIEADKSVVHLRVVSWADEHHHIHQPTLPFVLQRFYGGYAFPRFNQR